MHCLQQSCTSQLVILVMIDFLLNKAIVVTNFFYLHKNKYWNYSDIK